MWIRKVFLTAIITTISSLLYHILSIGRLKLKFAVSIRWKSFELFWPFGFSKLSLLQCHSEILYFVRKNWWKSTNGDGKWCLPWKSSNFFCLLRRSLFDLCDNLLVWIGLKKGKGVDKEIFCAIFLTKLWENPSWSQAHKILDIFSTS